MSIPHEIKIRDFIYMDIDRLKSIMAQCYNGLYETKTQGNTSSGSTSLNGEAGIFGTVKVTSGHEYLYASESTETKSLHDHIYTMVEDFLISKQLLTRLPETPGIDSSNVREKLRDTSFILMKGKVRIDDSSQINAFLMPAIQFLQFMTPQQNQVNQSNLNSAQAPSLQPFDLSRINPNGVNVLADVIKLLAKDRIILSINVYESSEIQFIGTLDKDKFRDNISNIIFKYTTAPDSDWIIFGQVCAIPQPRAANETPNQIQNQIQAAFNMNPIFEGIRNFEFISSQNVKYPNISITPIAIYREERAIPDQDCETSKTLPDSEGEVAESKKSKGWSLKKWFRK